MLLNTFQCDFLVLMQVGEPLMDEIELHAVCPYLTGERYERKLIVIHAMILRGGIAAHNAENVPPEHGIFYERNIGIDCDAVARIHTL